MYQSDEIDFLYPLLSFYLQPAVPTPGSFDSMRLSENSMLDSSCLVVTRPTVLATDLPSFIILSSRSLYYLKSSQRRSRAKPEGVTAAVSDLQATKTTKGPKLTHSQTSLTRTVTPKHQRTNAGHRGLRQGPLSVLMLPKSQTKPVTNLTQRRPLTQVMGANVIGCLGVVLLEFCRACTRYCRWWVMGTELFCSGLVLALTVELQQYGHR
ncbi:uncharacterized protein LOC120154982 [Hibiscus syriacus]|uniref:uncharacterized protein LOC120154982 n=1 Tax=Hibiscus syriacus TaxID=106335 RepID=UPI001921FB4D|nr:uncharacterized protein LOC120154982 [Hibiscus syriacus]